MSVKFEKAKHFLFNKTNFFIKSLTLHQIVDNFTLAFGNKLRLELKKKTKHAFQVTILRLCIFCKFVNHG